MLLWFVLRRIAFAELLELFNAGVANWPLLLVALALPILGLLSAAMRWQLLLAGQNSKPPIRTLFTALLVGSFYNQLFPSTIGGDVARSWWVAKPIGSQLLSMTVVGLDRAIGLIGISATALLAAAAAPSVARQVPEAWTAMAIGVVLVSGAISFARSTARSPRRLSFSSPRLQKLKEKASTIYPALAAYRTRRRHLLAAVFWSMAIQILIIIQYKVLAVALGIDVSPWGLAVVIPIVTVVALIPVTINGIGLRESSLAVLGGMLGLTVADAVALGWLVWAAALFYGVVGGFVHLLGRRPLASQGG